MPDIPSILKAGVQLGASDLLFIPNEPPLIRVLGKIQKINGSVPLSPQDCKALIYSLLTEDQRAQFQNNLELDCSYSLSGVSRFRLNVFVQNRGVAAVLRVIADRIPTPQDIGLTPTIMKLIDLPRGLVLVTGPTGSGKTTTLAALIEAINQKSNKLILTIEDPIEFIYENKLSIINQREVGQHTQSFAKALKHSLRQNPDVLLIGEMRDLETIALAVTAAETGHLCFGTLHTQDAASTVDRMIDVFPPDQKSEIRLQVSTMLAAVVSQTLVPRKTGGRVCAREVMINVPGIANLIREGKTSQIYGAIEAGSQYGMISMDQHLAALVRQGAVEFDEALAKAHNPSNLRNLIALGTKTQ